MLRSATMSFQTLFTIIACRSPKYGILCQIRLTLHRSLPAVPGRSYVPSTSVYPLRGTPGEPAHRTRLDSRRIRLPLLLYQQPVTGIIFSVFPAIPGTKGDGFICSPVNRATAFYPLLKEAQASSDSHTLTDSSSAGHEEPRARESRCSKTTLATFSAVGATLSKGSTSFRKQ